MFCSAIIPTIGRSTLSRSVYSVLNQEFGQDEFEIIVVNDTGQPLPEMEWQRSPRNRTIITQKRERSVARNAGAAIARGEYLYFLDDDDIMLPGAMQEFWELSRKTDAQWLFGSYQTVDNDGGLVAEFHPDIAGNISAWLAVGEAIPLQTSLFHIDAFYGGGEFDVYYTAAQDRDLERRISMCYQVANTQKLLSQIRVGQEKSSTNWSKVREFDRQSREKALINQMHFNRYGPQQKVIITCTEEFAGLIWPRQLGISNINTFSNSGVVYFFAGLLEFCMSYRQRSGWGQSPPYLPWETSKQDSTIM